MRSEKWEMIGEKWQVISDRWQVAGGRWQVASGKWYTTLKPRPKPRSGHALTWLRGLGVVWAWEVRSEK